MAKERVVIQGFIAEDALRPLSQKILRNLHSRRRIESTTLYT